MAPGGKFDMKISDKTYVLIIFAVILALSFISYWHIKRFQATLPEIEWPKFEMPKIEIDWGKILSPEKEGEQEWFSPDGKLKLTYSVNWMAMDESILEHGRGAGIILDESEVLLFAYRLKTMGQAFALLTVIQISAEKSLEEIIEEIEQNVKIEGGEMKVVMREIEGEIARLETTSEYPGQPSFYSKGKIIFTKGKTYLIFLTSSQKDWPQFEEEAKEIFDSAELLE